MMTNLNDIELQFIRVNDDIRKLATELEDLLISRSFNERTEAQQTLLMALNDFFEAAE